MSISELSSVKKSVSLWSRAGVAAAIAAAVIGGGWAAEGARAEAPKPAPEGAAAQPAAAKTPPAMLARPEKKDDSPSMYQHPQLRALRERFKVKLREGKKALVATQVASGDPAAAGGKFEVVVKVASNDTDATPSMIASCLYFPADKLKLVGVTDGGLGQAGHGPVRKTDAGADYVEVVTMSNIENKSLTPAAYTVGFEVLKDAKPPFEIRVDRNARSSRQLLAVDLSTDIPVEYDNSATKALGAAK